MRKIAALSDVEFALNRPQSKFLKLRKKFRAYVAGFGSGKTFVGCAGQAATMWEIPNSRLGYFAPTFPHIRDIYYPTIEDVATRMGLNVKIKTGDREVDFYSGRKYRGTVICRSMDRPDSIVGFKIGDALIDELDVLPKDKATLAWRKIIARLRDDRPGVRNGADITTTPEGFRFVHSQFVQALQEKPNLSEIYGMVQASTYDNAANLPDGYISSLLDTYPENLISAYLGGQFVNLTSGTVYRNYDRVRCSSRETIKEGEPLFIGMDFNVQHMAATVYVQRPSGWHAVAEIKDVFDTPDMILIIKERWQSNGHKIIIYPDASGKNRKSVDAQKSDIALLEQAKFAIPTNPANPAVKDRIAAMNKQLQDGRVWVNAALCPTVARCLESQSYDANGEPDKKGGFDHQNDATTYPIAYEFPIHRPVIIAPITFAM